MYTIIFFLCFTKALVNNITAGLGLNGGTITDFGTINLSNISAGNWKNPKQINIDGQGRLTNVLENNNVFSTPSSIVLNNQGYITNITNIIIFKELSIIQNLSPTFFNSSVDFVYNTPTPSTTGIYLPFFSCNLSGNSVVQVSARTGTIVRTFKTYDLRLGKQNVILLAFRESVTTTFRISGSNFVVDSFNFVGFRL